MRFLLVFGPVCALALSLVGCGADPACRTDVECAATPDTPSCEPVAGVCGPRPTLIGSGSALAAPTLTAVYTEENPLKPTGFGFNPVVAGEVWITNYADNSVHILAGVGVGAVTGERKRDPAHAHFMHRPTGLAFNERGDWATCGDGDNGGDNFMGPALFSSEPAIFAKQTPGTLGSHLDMLHASPFCMGIGHMRENKFWVFDGYHGAVVLYDFREDHGPGNDDHSDGEIFVHGLGAVERLPGVPSHLAYDPTSEMLFVANAGGGTVLRLDTRTGTEGDAMPALEPSIPIRMDDTSIRPIVAPGLISVPSGLTVDGALVYVGDRATGTVFAFDHEGREWARWVTGLPADALGALAVGPDHKLYLLDSVAATLHRVDLPAASR